MVNTEDGVRFTAFLRWKYLNIWNFHCVPVLWKIGFSPLSLDVNIRCLWQRAISTTMTVEKERRLSLMLNENIKAIIKSKWLSQQELAVKLSVVRQTVSKWEQGLSVPDSDMLISISEVLETPVSTLLGEAVVETGADTLKAISEKLEVINLQLAQRKTTRRIIIRWLLIALCTMIA